GGEESGAQRRNGGGRPRPRLVARNGLDKVEPGVQPVSLVAAEEARAIPGERAANRTAELVLLQLRLRQRGDHAAVDVARRVEVVPRIEPVAPRVFEERAVEAVGTGLGDDAHLAAGACSVFGGITARLDPEFLDVLEARLELERRVVLAVDV